MLWPLTTRWYGTRLDPDWRPIPADELQQMLTDAGLTGPFWQLT